MIYGILALFVSMIAFIVLRGYALRSKKTGSNFVYRDLRVITSEGSNPGVMVYAISILTAIIGPFSYRLYPLNDLGYVVMNVVAALFFVLIYPQYAPVTGFATVDVIEVSGTRYCIVGKVMNRRFKVATITERPKFEIIAETGRGRRLIFEVTDRSSSPM